MTDLELSKIKIGDIAIEEMTSITFLGWVSKKINGLQRYTPAMNELSLMISRPPLGKMSIENKIEVIRKLEKLGIEI